MRNITGPPVIGTDFFGREDEFDYVWRRILNQNNFIFPSPRRVGKTSFAFKLLEKAKQEGWHTISINLEESATSELDFLEAFIKKLQGLSWWERTKARGADVISLIGRLKPTLSAGGIDAKLEWESKRNDIYTQVAELLNHEENTLIFFDELTVLLTKILKADTDGLKKVTNFLHWLRALRQKKGSNIRWIYCSSVGIENFTHQNGISDTMNDVTDYHLKSYSKEMSKAMLAQLGKDNELVLTDEIKNAIIEKLEYCLPFFLQIIFEKIKFLKEIEQHSVDDKILNTAYTALIEEKHFNTWVERINEQYNHNKTYAFALLKVLCQEKGGTGRGTLMNAVVSAGLSIEKAEETTSLLLYMLRNDGYIMEESSLYRFRSPLLRDFWFNRHIK